ncbi:hypothetical protein OF83DRAFT_1166077 [Amylostereum chailletii]|nr:hypothetical protein OF83DRAFT_1166077 [Amylostereum chailletii]
MPPCKRRRRTATSLLAGDFDARPPRDVLTSLLNGVPVYKEVEDADEEKQQRRRERKEREREKKRAKLSAMARTPAPPTSAVPDASAIASSPIPVAAPRPLKFDADRGHRPTIRLPGPGREGSYSPPLDDSSMPSTPDPSVSSSTSHASSKRPHTPGEDFDMYSMRDVDSSTPPPASAPPRPRKKRVATRKGWKGWVEGSPPPSEKLINLDEVEILTERRTRSGKNFDGISLGQASWV